MAFKIQIKRNNASYVKKEDALAGLKAQLLTTNKMGEPIIACYNGGVLLGVSGLERGTYQIFEGLTIDVDGNVFVPETTQKALDALYEQLNIDIDTKLNDKIDSLDVTDPEVIGKVVVAVNETDGKVESVKKEVKDIQLKGYESQGEDGSLQISSDDTVGTAFGAIETYIKNLDVTEIKEDGKAIVSVSEENGRVSAKTGNITASSVEIVDFNNIIDSTNVEDALQEIKKSVDQIHVTSLDNTITITKATGQPTDIAVNVKADENIIRKDGNGGIYTNISLTKETSGLASNIKERYLLKDSYGNRIGDPISIYKDSALLSVALLHANGENKPSYNKATNSWTDIADHTERLTAMCFAYEDVDGVIQIIAIPVGNFLVESEFKDGLIVNGLGEVYVKKDETSGKVITNAGQVDVITISSDGVKIANIQEAIDYAVSLLVSPDSAERGEFVTSVSEDKGIIKVTRQLLTEAYITGYARTFETGNLNENDTLGKALSKIENNIEKTGKESKTAVEKDVVCGNAANLDVTKTVSPYNGNDIYTIGIKGLATDEDLQNKFNELNSGLEDLRGGDTDATVKGLDEKIKSMDFPTPAGNVIIEVSQTDGQISAKGGMIHSNDKTVNVGLDLDLSVNLDNKTVVKNNATGEISVQVKASEQVIKTDNSGLYTTLTLSYLTGEQNKAGYFNGRPVLQLLGYNNSVVTEIDATPLIRDGLLSKAELKKGSEVGPAYSSTDTYLVLSFNTDGPTDPVVVNVTSLIDVYKAGEGLSLSSDNTFAIKLDINNENDYLSVSNNGLKLNGIISLRTRIENLENKVGSSSVEANINDAINGLNKDDSPVDGKYVAAVSETNGIVKVERKDFGTFVLYGYTPSSATGDINASDQINVALSKLENAIKTLSTTTIQNSIKSEIEKLNVPDSPVEGKYVSTVSETNGLIYVDRADFGTASLRSFSKTIDTGNIAPNDQLNVALSKLENGIKAVDDKVGTNNVTVQISNAINGLTKGDNPADGKYVSAVSETNGIVDVKRDNFISALLTGYNRSAATGNIAGGDQLDTAFSKLENAISSLTLAVGGELEDLSGLIGSVDVSTQIAEAINGLKYDDEEKDGQYVSSVSEEKGIINVKRQNLTGTLLTGYIDSGQTTDIISSDRLDTALSKLQNRIKKLADLVGTTTVLQQIINEINKLNFDGVKENGKYVSVVRQTNGEVYAEKDWFTKAKLDNFTTSNDHTKIQTGDTLEVALSKLQNYITDVADSVGGNYGDYGGPADGQDVATQIRNALSRLRWDDEPEPDDGTYVYSTTQSDGKISVIHKEIGTIRLLRYAKTSDTGEITNNDTLSKALSRLRNNQVNGDDALNTRIDNLDETLNLDNGLLLASITQTDGKLTSITPLEHAKSKITGYSGSYTGINANMTLSEALSTLGNNINSLSSSLDSWKDSLDFTKNTPNEYFYAIEQTDGKIESVSTAPIRSNEANNILEVKSDHGLYLNNHAFLLPIDLEEYVIGLNCKKVQVCTEGQYNSSSKDSNTIYFIT